MSLKPGDIVGDYEVTGVIGAGGMGSVYKVRNLISDRYDAMKVLLPDLRESSDLADRFLNEIKVLASLRHPNIAALNTALRVDNQLLMIMELVEGTNLDERLRSGTIALSQGIRYASQVLSALAYAHGRGVIHRDIKPANIAVDHDDRVKLLDFGIARGAVERHLTKTGMVLGSLFYMSPEQVLGQPADARSDLYSVGITLYRIVTGRRPIDGEGEFAVMRAQVNDIPPPPSQWNPSLPQELSDVIGRSLAKSPGDRFQTAEQFRRALAPFLETVHPEHSAAAHLPTMTIPVFTGTTPLPSTSMFHTAALAAVQKNLAQWLGPIAGAVVRKQSKISHSLQELCQALAEQIPSEEDRRAFLKACRQDLSSHMPATALPIQSTPVPVQPVSWDPGALDRSRKHLAGFIGPMAKIMVDRAAKKARTVDEFLSLLSAEISSPQEREKFLAARGQIFG